MPGVRGVWTGADFTADNSVPFTCGMPLKNCDGSPLLQTNRRPLMTDKVRYVGDPVAFVVADSVAQARDAAEAVVLEIELLPAVMTNPTPPRSRVRHASTITFPTMSRWTTTMVTPPRWKQRLRPPPT